MLRLFQLRFQCLLESRANQVILLGITLVLLALTSIAEEPALSFHRIGFGKCKYPLFGKKI